MQLSQTWLHSTLLHFWIWKIPKPQEVPIFSESLSQ